MFNNQYFDTNSRIQNLLSQKSFIDQQLNTLQNQIPINNTVPVTQAIPTQYDFNGKWVNGYKEAQDVATGTIPTIIMDKKESKFYIKNIDGSLQAFSFTPITIQTESDKIASLEKEINELKSKMNTGKQLSMDDMKKGSGKNG